MDLLLSSLLGADLRKLGPLTHPAILPLVGADAIDAKEGQIMTACEGLSFS